MTIPENAYAQHLADCFRIQHPLLPGQSEERLSAFQSFSKKGLPNKRVEEFKYTDVKSVLADIVEFAARPAENTIKEAIETANLFGRLDTYRITLVDGFFIGTSFEPARLAETVKILPMAEALAGKSQYLQHLGTHAKAADNPLYQLNSAFMADGVVIHVGKNAKLDKPLHLQFLAGRNVTMSASRVLVLVEDGAELTLFESHESADDLAIQRNDIVEFVIGNGATVHHVRCNAEGNEALAFSTVTARMGHHVSFNSLNSVFGARVARHQIYLAFDGEKSFATVNGTALLKGSQHSDATLIADHTATACTSRELFKTVIDDQATGVFQGRINVAAEAQKTDGKMMSACLLLSDKGEMFNKPELEIFADDVQCGHGATCGALDHELLFYLESRGLPRLDAERLLIQAFLGEAVEMLQHEGARDELMDRVSRWLQKRG